jgi:hypothetical protein
LKIRLYLIKADEQRYNVSNISKEWNSKQAKLKELLSHNDKFDEAIALCLDLHSLVHESSVSKSLSPTYLDMLWKDLNDHAFRFIIKKGIRSIAWNIWHLTRIEDITVNILINDSGQVFNKDWMKKMNVSITDTGNAMSFEETTAFSSSVSMKELRNYRKAVGKNTKKIIMNLKQDDLKRKFKKEQIARILDAGGVLNVEGSKWLLDFWGRKTVAGILMMPVTRHQITHVNESFRIKERYS